MANQYTGNEPLTQEQEDTLIEGIATGDSVAKIAKKIGVSVPTIYRRIDSSEELLDKYTRAKQSKAQVLAEEIIEIADNDDLKPDDKRIRVDARKWVAGKYYGKLFGDKITQEHTGTIDLSGQSDDQLAAKIKAILASNVP